MAMNSTTPGQALEAVKTNHLWWTNKLDAKQAHHGQPSQPQWGAYPSHQPMEAEAER